ncbi:MAG: hypothetical protein IE927_06820 [Rhodobacterales bacterium]|nr:hypothetical protein [Rhodobacterales bacterium]
MRVWVMAGLMALMPVAGMAKDLTGAEIKALLSGKTGTWQTADGKIKGTNAWGKNGVAKVTGNFGKFTEDTGTWRIDGNQYCAKWTKIRDGKELCNPVEVVGKNRYRVGNSLFSVNP